MGSLMVGVQEQLKEEVLRMAKQVNAAGFNLLCIDTENQFVTTGFGKDIAQVPCSPQLLADTAQFAYAASAKSSFSSDARCLANLLYACRDGNRWLNSFACESSPFAQSVILHTVTYVIYVAGACIRLNRPAILLMS